MKLLTSFFLMVGMCSYLMAQTPDSAKATLISLEQKMFEAISKNDSAYLNQLIAEDYLAINADGVMTDKKTTLKNLSKFKGATYKLTDKVITLYGNSATIHGRAKFYFRSLLVADVYYTEIWNKTNATWKYAGWQGTMTGMPKSYPVIVTLITILLLWAIFTFVFKNRRKKTY